MFFIRSYVIFLYKSDYGSVYILFFVLFTRMHNFLLIRS